MKHSVKQISLKAVALGALLLMAILPMRAQWYVGGGLNINNGYDGKGFYSKTDVFSFRIHPEFGYGINNRIAVGAGFDMSYQKFHRETLEGVLVENNENFTFEYWELYCRHSVIRKEKFSLFLDYRYAHDVNYSHIGVRAGLSYDLLEHMRVTIQLGGIEYKFISNDSHIVGLDMDGNQFGFSLFYVFSKKK